MSSQSKPFFYFVILVTIVILDIPIIIAHLVILVIVHHLFVVPGRVWQGTEIQIIIFLGKYWQKGIQRRQTDKNAKTNLEIFNLI